MRIMRYFLLYILTSKCASRQSDVQFLMSHLAKGLCTRRFSEPPFQSSRTTNHWANAVTRDFPPSTTHVRLLLSHSFSSLTFSLRPFSSLTLPISAFPCVHLVGSLTSKLPSSKYDSERQTISIYMMPNAKNSCNKPSLFSF